MTSGDRLLRRVPLRPTVDRPYLFSKTHRKAGAPVSCTAGIDFPISLFADRAVLPHAEGALVMLGRKRRCEITGERVEEVFVGEEQMRCVRNVLHLGDQEHGWYRVAVHD